MFMMRRSKRMSLILVSMICFNWVRLPSISFGLSSTILILLYFFNELRYFQRVKNILKKTPILRILAIVVIGDIVLIWQSPHLHNLRSIVGFIINDLIGSYFVLAYAFIAYRNVNVLKKTVKPTLISLYIITAIGILQYFVRFSMAEIMGGGDSWFLVTGERNRVASLFFSPFDYGYINVLLGVFIFYLREKRIIGRNIMLISLICCLYGIIFCGCRTILATTILAIGCFCMIRYNIFKNIGLAVACCFVFICAYSSVPFVKEKTDFLLSAVDSNSDVEGSSSTMREEQFMGVLYHIRKNPLLGRGYKYFGIDLGWEEGGFRTLRDMDLKGLEGAIMGRLLERGILGVLVYLLFYLMLIRYIWKFRKQLRLETATAMSVLIACVAFGNMTGELNSVAVSMLFIGMYIGIAYSKKGNKIIVSRDVRLSACNNNTSV